MAEKSANTAANTGPKSGAQTGTKAGAKTGTKASPAEFIRQVQAESRKVVWPTRQETITTAIFVGIMMVIMALFFLGIDTIFGAVVQFLLTLA